MSDDRQTIEDYAQAFERCLAGPAQEKARSRTELVAHLYDAAEAGELAEVRLAAWAWAMRPTGHSVCAAAGGGDPRSPRCQGGDHR